MEISRLDRYLLTFRHQHRIDFSLLLLVGCLIIGAWPITRHDSGGVSVASSGQQRFRQFVLDFMWAFKPYLVAWQQWSQFLLFQDQATAVGRVSLGQR
jgi:hypothetical protein